MMIVYCLIFIAILLLIYGFSLNYFFKTEEYIIADEKIKKPFRAVFLSDLHTARFGKKNEKLIEKIRQINPDMVFITGDMVVKNGKRTECVYYLCQTLAKEYPVYYSPGNHEIRLADYDEFKRKIRSYGVYYLENDSVYLPEQNVVVTGLDLPEDYYHKCWKKVCFSSEELAELITYEEPESFHVLLAHNPEYMPVYGQWGANLTLSGHLHGGIAILPGLGGVISPSLRLFPKYDQGYRCEKGCHSIISRGLGLHHIKLRFFNVPELAVINFTC
ncbi:MAG: metallophosphoesterase [Eubacterium sp.]|nr:metallophosphoesterase [Eubacterium sp.]